MFVVLKGPRRGQPLTAAGVDEIVTGARTRAGLARLTCHQLRHTCFTRLREAGMALEAIQAQAGHRSIESTRIYLHLANDWLAGEYRRASEAIDAQATLGGRDARRRSGCPTPGSTRSTSSWRRSARPASRRGARRQQAARTFCGRLQRAGGWAQLSRARQLEATDRRRRSRPG